MMKFVPAAMSFISAQTLRFVLLGALLVPSISYAQMEPQPIVRLRSLDKITARTMTFEAQVGSTVKFGPLFIKIRACHRNPPMEQPESAAFLQIWENSLKDNKPHWVYSGWMYASSPALAPMDHPVFDVWLLECFNKDDVLGDGPAPKMSGEIEYDDDFVDEEAPSSPDVDIIEDEYDDGAAYNPLTRQREIMNEEAKEKAAQQEGQQGVGRLEAPMSVPAPAAVQAPAPIPAPVNEQSIP
jgi:hypothetical protein